MGEKQSYCLFVVAILIASVMLAGCSSQSSTTQVTQTPSLAKFKVGDIVAKTSSSSDQSLYLILSYNEKKDEYNRAWIYRNADGSWGHRIDIHNETVPRALVEKVYPVKVAHVDVSSVPIAALTVPPTVQTTSGATPSITNVSPASGGVDTSVIVTVTGNNFQDGATLKLLRGGSPLILGTAVSASSGTLTGTFNLKGATEGHYTVIVTNPDGQASSLANGFEVGSAIPYVVGVYPNTGAIGDKVSLTINGQNFGDLATVSFTKGGSTINPIYITDVSTMESTKVFCTLKIPTGTPIGDWTVTVLNVATQKSGTWSQTFHITNQTAT